MDFRIADTFSDSLAKLMGDEQKAVKTTAFDLQMNPANPGMQFHRLDKAKDRNFFSVRVSADIRIIVHKTRDGLLLCYVGHHDDAYRWAERRKIERHPKTGAAQLVEIRETVREIEIPRYVESVEPAASPRTTELLFAKIDDDALLSYGVPLEWLSDVHAATEDSLLGLCDHLPKEAAEALLDLATGTTPSVPQPIADGVDAFAHPDAQRRFRVMTNVEELQRALEYPWEKWTVFLHPAQREIVERSYNGPARVSGSAGTGKTVVAIHRAVHLAQSNPKAKVLLTTFSRILARFLRQKLDRLIGNEPKVADRIDVAAIGEVGRRLYSDKYGEPHVVAEDVLRQMLRDTSAQEGNKWPDMFLYAEWSDVVDAWNLKTWEEYRGVARLGRKTRLSEKQRESIWAVFERVRENLRKSKLVTSAEIFLRAAEGVKNIPIKPYDYAVVDEAQDITVAQLRFLAALSDRGRDSLFFAGDLGQRIFQTPFSWKSLGVDIRGRSYTLRINYRTSHQIRRQADRLLPGEISDVDGNVEQRRGTVSVFNGPEPEIETAGSIDGEIISIANWIKARIAEGVQPAEIGIFVRSVSELDRARRAVKTAGRYFVELDNDSAPDANKISISTMHLAKGLEYRAVVVMAVDEGVVPLESRIEAVADNADLEEVFDSERHLLYVACTRARDYLRVSGVEPASEFVEDLIMQA